MAKWVSIEGVVGVRYREHPERKFLRRPDRYFSIRYKDREGKTREEGVGWASDGTRLAARCCAPGTACA